MDFAETNIYKSRQVATFAALVKNGSVKRGDAVLFADAWHPGVINVRYMSDLLDLGVRIHVLWHSGSYDKADFLGRKVQDKEWSYGFERAAYHAASRSYFATDFHREMFVKKLRLPSTKARVVGWPMEYLPGEFAKYKSVRKDKIILFPHRIAPEKQPEVFRSLASVLPSHELVFAQKQSLSKDAYRDLVARSEAIFSASLQETLGIGVYEGLLCGAMPIVPKRLSYQEMYGGWCYNSSWSTSKSAVKRAKSVFGADMRAKLLVRDEAKIDVLAQKVGKRFFDGNALYDHLFGSLAISS